MIGGDPDTYTVIGAGMAVHRELGCGFLEAVYRAALGFEFHECGIPFVPEVLLPITYKGTRLPLNYRVDFICYDSVLVEVKALDAIGDLERAQAINYLRASGKHRALVLNFGARSLQHSRVVYKWRE
jgi:GxxExxY protein